MTYPESAFVGEELPGGEPREAGRGAEGLVWLRKHGGKPPLFFIPAGHGDMRTFRDVVALLDNDRPVYGLWIPRVELIEGLRNKPVSWLVSVYVTELKRVQPEGPYHLSGYSAGGLIMVEVARELIRKGDTVESSGRSGRARTHPDVDGPVLQVPLLALQPDATD